MSVINALASQQRDPNQQMMQSAQYASNAWGNFMSGMIMKRAGDEMLDLFTEGKGKVEPKGIAKIAKKYHMPLNQFGEMIGLLQKSGALEIEKKKWGEPIKATGEGLFREGTVWGRDPETGKPTIFQKPLEKKGLTAQQKITNARNKVTDAEGARKEIRTLEVLKGKIESQGLTNEDITVLGKENSALAGLMTSLVGKKLSPDRIKQITDALDQEIDYYRGEYKIPAPAKKPADTTVTHIWENGKLVPVGE